MLPPAASIAKGPVWASPSPGPSLWGKTKADFEPPPKAVQQPTGGDFWVPENFDGVDNYNDEGDGGGSGGGRDDLWESMTTNSKQIGKAAPIPVKQQQSSGAAQRLRRVSEAASSPAPRTLGTKDVSDIGQPAPSVAISNSKKTRGKKNSNGKGKQRATVEEVPDEEEDNIDILPQDSNFIMESKVILEPKPSVPPVVYDPIIKFADNDLHEIDYLASTFRPTAPMASDSDDIFGMESHYSNAFKTQGVNTSIGSEWGTINGNGKHARWTPAITHEESASPNFSASFGPSLQGFPNVQQKPIWGQPTKSSAKDKGKGK